MDHRQLGVDLFNHVWTLLETEDRTQAQDDEMVHAAHASRHHWAQVGESINLARGEWQISRVYAVVRRAEPARFHAQRCLDMCLDNKIGDFDLAYAYEALARAEMVAGNRTEAEAYLDTARRKGADIADNEDRVHFDEDLATVLA